MNESLHPPALPRRRALRVWTAVMVTALALGSTVANAADQVAVRLKWFHQAQFAGFYVAQAQGLYRDANLDVDIQPGGPDFPAVQMVAGGSEDFGVTSADQILVARSKGVPVVALAVLYRKSPFVLFAKKGSGIAGPTDFAGRRIGVKVGGNEELVYRALLKQAGLGADDVHEIPVKFDLTPLLTGQVDLWPGYVINEVLAAREQGVDVDVIWPSDYGIDLYADTLFTTEKTLRERPELVGRFVRATLAGWAAALADPQQAARATLTFGNKLTYDHELAMLEASAPLLRPDDQPLGSMQPERWQRLQALLLGGGFLKTPLELERAYTLQFVGDR